MKNLILLVLVLPLILSSNVEVDAATVTVVPEVPEHSFYLMQRLRNGGTNH